MSEAAQVSALFGHSADGFVAASLEDLAWLAVPVDAGIKIASGWNLRGPMSAWTVGDFGGAAGIVPDEAGFRQHVDEIAAHRSELRALQRVGDQRGVATPWGTAQGSEIYGEGVVFHSTASHGGFELDRIRNAAMPHALRNPDGWYEEDAEWAKVATGFPELFTAYERRHAEKTLRNSYPDAWEAVNGRMLDPSESFEKERRQFHADHADDWIVVSAGRSDLHAGQIEVAATLGGGRGHVTVRRFLVPAEDYRVGRHGFVIDLARHVEILAA